MPGELRGCPVFDDLRTYWDPLRDVTYVELAQVQEKLLATSFCLVHDVPPVTDEEQAIIEAGDIDDICIMVVRVQ